MSYAATASMVPEAEFRFDPVTLSGGRVVEWHLRVDDNNDVLGLDLRYNTGVDLPGILSLNRLAEGGLHVPRTVFSPSVTEIQGARDAVEVLADAGLRSMVLEKAGAKTLAGLDAFVAAIKAKYLN